MAAICFLIHTHTHTQAITYNLFIGFMIYFINLASSPSGFEYIKPFYNMQRSFCFHFLLPSFWILLALFIYSRPAFFVLGCKHVKGILLFGPPGCGKTLMARQIGKMLNAREPKVVNGPEILNKYVGESEANIRKLFADAEEEQKRVRGTQCTFLHVQLKNKTIFRLFYLVPHAAGSQQWPSYHHL